MTSEPSSFPRTSNALREALTAEGFRPRRRHGQNFLTDVQAVDAIVRDSGAGPADRVIEVGTGPGLLTHALCETGAQIVSFDIDPALQGIARRLRTWPERVSFQTVDVLKNKHTLAAPFAAALAVRPPPPGQLLLVSNLPYSAATPILLSVLSLEEPPDRIVVMIQLEVGEKMLATHGHSNYGVPSVAVGLKATGRILRRFGNRIFWPAPKVRSVLLELTPRRPAALGTEEHGPFGAFVTALFTRRRKVLTTALRAGFPALSADEARAAVEAEGLRPELRAEAVSPDSLLALWRRLQTVS